VRGRCCDRWEERNNEEKAGLDLEERKERIGDERTHASMNASPTPNAAHKLDMVTLR
jgi:hypothetical protein